MKDEKKIAEETNRRVLRIQSLYKLYFEEIKKLKLKQEEMVLDFIRREEKKQIEKIRSEIKNNY